MKTISIYTGVTSNLYSRINEHKQGLYEGYVSKHRCTKLVYWEFFETIESAIEREKRLKKFKRHWKEGLIDKFNPNWKDLFDSIEEMQ